MAQHNMEVRESHLPPRATEIRIMVPLNYLNGSMLFKMRYEITPEGRSNYHHPIEVSTHYDQHLADGEIMDKIAFAPTLEIIKNITDVLEYFQYVLEFLDKNKIRPKQFSEWRKERG